MAEDFEKRRGLSVMVIVIVMVPKNDNYPFTIYYLPFHYLKLLSAVACVLASDVRVW